MRRIISIVSLASVILVPGAALAAHGKVGLWTVTSTMTMANMPDIPPEAIAMMKARHMSIPGSGQPMTSQMCMTAEEVNADAPPRMSDRDMQCDTKVLTNTPGAIHAETICHGRMEGRGETMISWRGNDHYEGSYHFKGSVEGQTNEITTHYSADFVKADCGAVHPFTPPQH